MRHVPSNGTVNDSVEPSPQGMSSQVSRLPLLSKADLPMSKSVEPLVQVSNSMTSPAAATMSK